MLVSMLTWQSLRLRADVARKQNDSDSYPYAGRARVLSSHCLHAPTRISLVSKEIWHPASREALSSSQLPPWGRHLPPFPLSPRFVCDAWLLIRTDYCREAEAPHCCERQTQLLYGNPVCRITSLSVVHLLWRALTFDGRCCRLHLCNRHLMTAKQEPMHCPRLSMLTLYTAWQSVGRSSTEDHVR